MINQYPLWKYLLVLVIVLAGAVYALPNIYGEDPAVQISATRGTDVTETTQANIQAALQKAGLTADKIERTPNAILLRFSDTEAQLKAQETIKQTLGENFTVALNLAPSTPQWLRALNASPMFLGLDLRGGIYFLMEVDVDAAVKQAEERYVDEMRALFRTNKARYISVGKQGDAIEAKFQSAEMRDKALALVRKELPNLVVTEVDGAEFSLRAKLDEKEAREAKKFAVQQNVTTLRNRVNELGVSEPVIQQQGERRIVVQLPGVQDTARAKEILGATATLEFRLANETHSVREAVEGRVPAGSKLYKQRNGDPILLQKRVIVTGDQITDASSGLDQQDGSAAVFINLDGQGARKMQDTTKENVNKLMAVVFIENKTDTRIVDGREIKTKRQVEEVINVARIREPFGKRFQITGLDSTSEARDLALLLRAGALKAPVDIVEERTVGPSMGAENIARGFNSTLYGFAAIAMFMTIYYFVFGFISVIALSANLLLLIAVLSVLQATLTLPGMAGIALTVGMAIDANVLIFERIREELRNGNTPQAAIHAGFDRAWSTIVDSNITILIAGTSLLLLGSGPVRGFAVVLCIGILTSMFSAVMVSRAIVNMYYGRRRKIAKLAIG